jgi:hypothetical protein
MKGKSGDGGWSPYLPLESVPPTWEKRFGPSVGKRAAGAFLGGIVAMSVSAFVALAMFFGVGVFVAALVHGRRSS